LVSIWLRIATALSEIVVGTIAQLVIGAILGSAVLGTDQTWIKFLSGTGAILLTFLAGAELDPIVFRERWKEAGAIGIVSFLVPFLGCTVAARYLLGWDPMASWLAGVAMSTTSVAVVYAVMLEFGFNATDYGKVVLAACFVTDLGTVLMLGLIFAPFTVKTLVFVAVCVAVLVFLPWVTAQFFRHYGGRPSELETKYLLLLLFALGGLAAYPQLRFTPSGRHVHDAHDVHRVDVRDHFVPFWLIAWHHQSGAVLGIGGSGDRECGHTDTDCQCAIPSSPSLA
jgi:Kef-type K+ transport system membrane component KefB